MSSTANLDSGADPFYYVTPVIVIDDNSKFLFAMWDKLVQNMIN
jgi:hypothetical protein